MVTKIQKWGNSQGLRFPKVILDQVHIDVGDEVDIKIRQGMIIIKPVTNIRGKYSLKELVATIPKGYKPKERNWGGGVGKEEW